MQRQKTAQLIWDDLAINGPSPRDQIQARTGLSTMQFWYGMGFLRDVLQNQWKQPLVYSPHYGVYDLTSSEQEWMEYLIDWRMRSILTQISRVEETAKAGGLKFGTRKRATRVTIAAISAARQMVEAAI